jgi:excisionase family DNA binding protein
VKLLSIAEAAEIMGLSEKSVRGAISRGELPASKVCGRVRVRKRDLKSWLADSRVQPRESRNAGSPLGPSVLGRVNGRRTIGAFDEALKRAIPDER